MPITGDEGGECRFNSWNDGATDYFFVSDGLFFFSDVVKNFVRPENPQFWSVRGAHGLRHSSCLKTWCWFLCAQQEWMNSYHLDLNADTLTGPRWYAYGTVFFCSAPRGECFSLLHSTLLGGLATRGVVHSFSLKNGFLPCATCKGYLKGRRQLGRRKHSRLWLKFVSSFVHGLHYYRGLQY